MRGRSFGLCLVALCLCGIAGCGTKTYPVRGKVVYKDDKTPVKGRVTIWFESTTPPYERASSPVSAEGEFILSTIKEHSGAMAGEHRIRFAPFEPFSEPSMEKALARTMHPKYLEYRTSGLTQTIVSGDNEFVIEVERAPKP